MFPMVRDTEKNSWNTMQWCGSISQLCVNPQISPNYCWRVCQTWEKPSSNVAKVTGCAEQPNLGCSDYSDVWMLKWNSGLSNFHHRNLILKNGCSHSEYVFETITHCYYSMNILEKLMTLISVHSLARKKSWKQSPKKQFFFQARPVGLRTGINNYVLVRPFAHFQSIIF